MYSNDPLLDKDTQISKLVIIDTLNDLPSTALTNANLETDELFAKNINLDNKQESRIHKAPGWGTRHTQALLVFMGLSMSFIIRLNLALAIVGMEKSNSFHIYLTPGGKALAVSSFFMGYSLLQVPAGNIGRKGYAVRLFSVANISSGFFCLILPYMSTTFGVGGIVVNRFMTGIVQGFVYPNLNNIMSRWIVPEERDSVMCLVHTGNPFGSLLVMVISGYLDHNFNWPSIFYVTGSLGILCGLIMYTMGSDSPEAHKGTSPKEKDYILRCLNEEPNENGYISFFDPTHSASTIWGRGTKPESHLPDYSKVDVPWKKILTSKPVLAMTFCAWCCYWSGWTLSLLVPSYIDGVLHFETDSNGVLSALPYLLCCLLSIIISALSNYLIKSALISDRIMRPLWNSIGMIGSGIPVIVLAFIPVNAKWAIALLTISASLNVACNVGYMVNHIDLSPRFAGVLMSVMNSFGNTASLLGPLVSTYMIKDESSQADWRNVFLLCGFMFFIGNAAFLLFGSTDRQKWDAGNKKDDISL